MNDKIERYKTALQSAFEIHRLRQEIANNIDVIAENLTAKEAHTRKFDHDSAVDALKLIDGVTFGKNDFVKFIAKYGDLEINLHSDPRENGSKAMAAIFEGIKIN